jgi:hypothetical protein
MPHKRGMASRTSEMQIAGINWIVGRDSECRERPRRARNCGTNIYSNPFRYPQVRHMRLSYRSIEIIDHGDRRQVFRTEWIRTGFGRSRAIFVCNGCNCGVIRLFARYGTYACCYCHRALLRLTETQSNRPETPASL